MRLALLVLIQTLRSFREAACREGSAPTNSLYPDAEEATLPASSSREMSSDQGLAIVHLVQSMISWCRLAPNFVHGTAALGTVCMRCFTHYAVFLLQRIS